MCLVPWPGHGRRCPLSPQRRWGSGPDAVVVPGAGPRIHVHAGGAKVVVAVPGSVLGRWLCYVSLIFCLSVLVQPLCRLVMGK